MDRRQHEGRVENDFPSVGRALKGDVKAERRHTMSQQKTVKRWKVLLLAVLALAAAGLRAGQAQEKKPNILVIFGDDVGQSNISAYSKGLMGYKTPNIDRIATEGMMFTDYYGEQSCTAGRSTFITGQTVLRTGLSKVGLPGADIGLRREDITIAEALKPLGYATGQFGKNHLGDKDEFLPSNHGFDEFFGNLYHLNAEEEPENPDYPKDPEFRRRYGPRGVIRSNADGKIDDTGPLTKKRMETIDDETSSNAPRAPCGFGRSHSPACGCRSSSTCAWTRTSGPTSHRTRIMSGPSGMPS
jgi:Sulfatase